MEVRLSSVIGGCTNSSRNASSISSIPVARHWTFGRAGGWVFGGAMQLELEDSLAFVTVTIAYQGVQLIVTKVLVDTGSEQTVLAGDVVAGINIVPRPTDIVHTISGVGGIETVFGRQVDYIQVGDRKLTACPIQVGGMDYGFEINGILGMDFLTQAGAVINLRELQIGFAD
jgi:hypothetical protein